MKKLERPDVVLVIVFLGVWGTIGLIGVLRLIEAKVDPTNIAIVTTLVGPVIGSMGAILVNTTKPSSDPVQATITNTDKNPVPTTSANDGTEDKTE